MRVERDHARLVATAVLGLATACADPTTSVSISEDGLTPQERSSGQLSSRCVVLDGALKCWHLGPVVDAEGPSVLMLRDELEPPLPLPAVDLGDGAHVANFDTELLGRTRCAALAGAGAKCWGTNQGGETADFDDYQLGHPVHDIVVGDDPDERGEGVPFVDLGDTDVVSVAENQFAHCALFDSGRVKCWGAANPTLGLGDALSRGPEGTMGDALPYLDFGEGVRAVGLTGHWSVSCIWTDDGRVKCWGHNDLSQTGTAPVDPIGDGPVEMGDALPYVDLGDDFFVVQVAAGSTHVCALSDTGRVKCWGSNADTSEPAPPLYEQRPPGDFGRLGLGDERVSQAAGPDLPDVDLGSGIGPVVAIAAGSEHTCALFDNGRIKCWGSGGAGRLGYGDRENRGDERGEMGNNLPFVDLGSADRLAIKLGCTTGTSCALMDDNTVLCWGAVLGEDGTYQPGATPGTMGDALIPVATAQELGPPTHPPASSP